LKIKLYSNVGNAPGALIDSAQSVSGYHPNAFTSSAILTNVRSNNVDGPLFALVPFVFTAVPDDRYFVVVQHRNHLPVMSRIPAVFAYSGDNYATYQNESGWDFTNWNGGINAVSALANSPNDVATNAHSNRYPAFGVFTSDSTDINYGITGLIHNEGRDESGTLSNRVSAMVAGDINQDTWIDATDRVIVRNEAGATVNLRSDVDGSGTIDATDRTIVDRNIGRRSSLYQVIPNLKTEADNNHVTSMMMMSAEDKLLAQAMDKTLENALIRGNAIQQTDGHYTDAKSESALAAQALKYQVSAEPKIVGDKVEVPLYIVNNGDDFALANCTFAIKFNPNVLRFATLSGTENVIFKNVDNTTSYQGIVHGPRPGIVNTVDNFRSIEILFDAALKSNKGVNVPKTKTYLGTLVFDMIQKNRAIALDWYNTSVWTTSGRNVTKSGEFLPIPPILTYSATVTVPNGGERYAVRRATPIQWSSVSPAAVHVEWSKDGGKTWTRVSFDPMSANANTFGWQTPGTPSFNNLIRIIDAETGIELDRSDAPFTIAAIVAGISRPASTDPIYKFGSNDNIIWVSDGIENARFEFTDNNVADFGWKQVVSSRRASDGKTQWTIPANVNTTRAIVRMIDMYDQQEVARSGEFKVLAGTLTFTYPREDVKLKANAKDRMRWSIKNNVKIADIEFSADGGMTWVTVKENVDVTKGILDWTIPSVNTTQGVLRAIYPKTPELEYDRTTFFTISGAISSIEDEVINGIRVSLPMPNPTDFSTQMTINLPSQQSVTIEIVDVIGQVVATIADNLLHEIGEMSVAIDTKQLISGSYYVRVQCGNTTFMRNLIVKHE
ncbi:MAG TPA: T9SS type A sorting domain-containing protein, partial [Candidatus Kapabacteria bacterium]|nr:T9SS type A sorting domain-containing protein [Candidatus Kapabacteria bacterium]